MLEKPKEAVSKVKILFLLLGIIIVGSSIVILNFTAKKTKIDSYDTRVVAYDIMTAASDVVLREKEKRSIEMSTTDDFLKTGLIGAVSSEITTTLGVIEAKRTAANPIMASFVVSLLEEKGIKAGDRVGAVFSGSFPGLNIAVLSACEAMGVECIYIVSVGSSSYGANNDEFTFPEMIMLLNKDGIISSLPAAYSIGGSNDVGDGLEPMVIEGILDRMNSSDVYFLNQADYHKNLQERQALMESKGEIDAFINVGGHESGMGSSDASYYYPAGWLDKTYELSDDSGLIEIYAAKGVEVLHLLNLKQLTSSYNMPFDSTNKEIPDNLLYYKQTNNLVAVLGLILILAVVCIERKMVGENKAA